MSSLLELYNEQIREHEKKPRNFGKLATANRSAEGHNTTCGDHFFVHLYVEEGVIRDISFEGEGCAIAKASASMMTRSVKGKSRSEVETIFNEFHRMVLGELDTETTPHHLGHLTVFSGVRKFPVRVKCASLSWHTLHAALAGEETTSTEDLGPALNAEELPV
ncbi:MAG TPA: SUF system NifU family Fe-S cluster assembly protein [Pyrinomonadaceae bacterium]|jgi:nitrogen fixation NifU-like protein